MWDDDDLEPDYDDYYDDLDEDDDLEEEDDQMTVTEWVGGSCACYAISGLGQCKDAKTAMRHWCRLSLGKGVPSKYGLPTFDTPAAHYIFIAGPEEAGRGHSKRWVQYGTEFAEFIRANKLGNITTLDARLNERHHPDTTCQVWLWQPDYDAVKGWWTDLLDYGAKNPPVLSNYRKSIKIDDICPNCTYRKSQHSDWDCPYGYGEWPDYTDAQWESVKATLLAKAATAAKKAAGW